MVLALLLTTTLATPLIFEQRAYAIMPQVHFNAVISPTAPLTNINTTDPTHILETPADVSSTITWPQYFTVTIHLVGANATNVPNGVQGLQVYFWFNISNALEWITPISYTDRLGTVGGVLNPSVKYGWGSGFFEEDNNTQDMAPPYTNSVQYMVAAASAGAAWYGDDGIIAVIEFEIVNGPSAILSQPDFLATFLQYSAIARDSTNAIINTDVQDATLQLLATPYSYPPRPKLFVKTSGPGTQGDASQYVALAMGETFNVSVMIGNELGGGCSSFWDVAGFDINFTYDPTLILLTNLYQGNFLGTNVAGWNVTALNTGTPGMVWMVQTKLPPDTPSGGTDSLFTMKFQVINVPFGAPLGCDLAIASSNLASWAHPGRPYGPWFGSDYAVSMPYNVPLYGHVRSNGHYTSPFIFPGPAIDLYDQYPYPYGGQGLNQHSDSFAPQELVCLFAKVTFAGDRITNKLVVFEVFDALGHKITLLQNYTDQNGIATVCFRLPMYDSQAGSWDPAIFGWWYVVATVSVDQVTVNDTMWFEVGWLVQVLTVVANNAPYFKYIDMMNFTAIILTIHEQPITALFSVDAYDVMGYPIGEAFAYWTVNATRVAGIPGNTTKGVYEWGDQVITSVDLPPYVHEVTPITDIVPLPTTPPRSIMIAIPTWARVGGETVIGYALTDFPAVGGTPLGPQSPAPPYTLAGSTFVIQPF